MLPMLATDSRRAKKMQAFRCSAEHLVARCDGGGDEPSNIVATHVVCNQRRHKRRRALPPDVYQSLVRSRMEKGRWHPESALRTLRSIVP
jgi:hypothetical protein